MTNYTIWSPQYSHFSGGIRALHILNEELNRKGFKSSLHYENQNHENNIILYPEIITDNPLNGKKICRWLLANANKKDLCFEWVKGLGGDYLLTVNIIDLNLFKPINKKRKNIGYWIGKGSKNLDLPENAEPILKFDPPNRQALAEQLASYEYIISFDSFSALNFESTLLGTPVYIANQTHDWSKEKLIQTGWPFHGFFWNLTDLEKAQEEVKKQYDIYKQFCSNFDRSIDEFIEITQKL